MVPLAESTTAELIQTLCESAWDILLGTPGIDTKLKGETAFTNYTRAGTNTPSDEYDTYRDTGWRIRYVSRIHFFSETKLGNG